MTDADSPNGTSSAASSPLPRRRYGPLPVSLARFIGRESEIAQLTDLLHRPEVRLVTLTGPGGVGKTHLALRAAAFLADQFADGAAFIDLAPIRAAELVVPTLVRRLSFRGPGSSPTRDHLVGVLRQQEMLLVIDNLEHVIEAGAELAVLLSACPFVRILATSRVRLHISGEHVMLLSPLPLPDPSPDASFANIANADAVRLFVDRAEAVRPGFALTPGNALAVAELCHRLDGLPLAIELAAGQSDTSSPEELLVRWENHNLRLVDGPRDMPTRHQALDAAIDWSYDLLSPDERRAFACLSVFSGSFTMTAALAVLGMQDDPESWTIGRVSALLAKSLLTRSERQAGASLYRMLGIIRGYGLRRLEDEPDAIEIRHRHAEYFAGQAEQAAADLHTTNAAEWLEQIDHEIPDMRAALVWSVEHDPVTAARVTSALVPIWTARGSLTEGRAWLDRVLATDAGNDRSPGAYRPDARRHRPARPDGIRLTSRERQVLQLIVDGLSDKEIASALSISARTVSNHVSGMLAKLGVSSRTAAATLALRQGSLLKPAE
jgi:non-specific serine/threonine protein kinase